MAGGLKPTRGPFSQFAEGGNPLHDWITDKRGHYTVSSGHHDRPGSGRRQRHRHWLGGGGFAARAAHKAILIGIGAATALRIVFAGITTQLLRLVGLLFAGGLLLLWVCWKMWRELRASVEQEQEAAEALTGYDINANGTIAAHIPRKTFVRAAGQIIIADVSMSLDNVLAVAGAAREHPVVLIFGLALSIGLMGVAASFIARLLQNNRWIAY